LRVGGTTQRLGRVRASLPIVVPPVTVGEMEHHDTPATPDTSLEALEWTDAFDHAHPAYNANAPEIWAGLRGKCPVAHTEAYGGTWLPVRHADVEQIARDTENFSSVGVVVSQQKPEWASAPLGVAPPITSDPPVHQIARRLLLPAFAPKAIEPWESEIRTLCHSLCDEMDAAAHRGEVVDAAVQYAQHIPVNVIARMIGLPLEDADLFRSYVHDVLEAVDIAPEERQVRMKSLGDYLNAHVDARTTAGGGKDDLISYLLEARLPDGSPLTREHIVGSMILLLIAGIDTTWSAIGSSLFHLATHDEDRTRLVAEPELMSTAVEEFLRAYAPVTMARVVANDVEIGGVTMRRGDWTLLPFPAANLDPEMFERADEVLIDREVNRHAAFGLGIHRCLGSNLARLELRVALEVFCERFPEFHLAGPVRWSVGQVRGPRNLPVRVVS
jgi:cytochrome P450